jgi:hypothetical protein
MIDRRRLIRLALAVAALPVIGLLPSSSAYSQQAFQRFIPLLVDLQGWTGKTADGMAMDIPGSSMITATREYERGEARLNAQIVTGPPAMGALQAIAPGMKIETSEGRVSTSTIDGLQVAQTFNTRDKSGVILVALGPSALLSVTFSGIADDEGLALARKFNWKAIQAAVPK